jgi:CRP/FNR family transcriptional regulator, anaerobic regulatory protein
MNIINHTIIKHFIDAGFNPIIAENISRLFVPRLVKKNGRLSKTIDSTCRLAFIQSGDYVQLRVQDGNEKVVEIYSENDYFVESNYNQINTFKCINQGIVWFLTEPRFVLASSEIDGFSEYYTAILKNEINRIQERYFDLSTLNTEKLYLKTINEHPRIIMRIPVQYLASWLGVTPRHLSRIRSKIV